MKLNEKLGARVRASWRYLLGSLTGLVNRVRSGLGPQFRRPNTK
ncbi:unnamed protein product [Gemmata massiliana]|uniref:Uncharacterized protein n=1 Tax=Gemmata massiliana TaxID=1210884 RepID=A0A6P2DH61_9BACT|nr:hypothetical protein [Gemmata massiliana]VTS00387.1 unnamed protein product [Gemmata massiliana]